MIFVRAFGVQCPSLVVLVGHCTRGYPFDLSSCSVAQGASLTNVEVDMHRLIQVVNEIEVRV